MNPLLATLCGPLLFATPDLSETGAPPGDKLPKGPPWHVTYREAKRDALRQGRPVFVYFTKTY